MTAASVVRRAQLESLITVPTFRKDAPANPNWDAEVRLLAVLATSAAVSALLFYFRSGDVLLYGDAVAHMNIARRVFDSKTPGLLQLGTVWLPLPHLLMIPFLLSDEMWQRGVGGSIPSLVAYVLGVVGMFRLVRGSLLPTDKKSTAARVAAWAGALVYAGNPNLIYMQTTAMGEALYLALFIWAVVYFTEWVRGDGKALTKCGLCLAAACLTRYDGWFLAAVMGATGTVWSLTHANDLRQIPPARTTFVRFLLIAAAAPVLWLVYNGIVYRNPLEFANGPYSAKAIEEKTQSSTNPGHPGNRNPVLAGLYFLKSGEDNVAENQWLQRAWVLLVVAAMAGVALAQRTQRAANARTWPLLFLLVPVPFYALSVAYGGVPIFVPQWWPFTHYNVRYGLQLLPAFAVAPAMCIDVVLSAGKRKLRAGGVLAILALVVASYASIWRAGPVCLNEAQINMRMRNLLERQVASLLHGLPSDATLLMYLGDHVGALQHAGIPLRRVINEGNHRVWKQPSDPDGLWERALADPAHYADYVMAFEGDTVWQAMQLHPAPEIVEIHVTGQARAILYRTR